MTEILLRDRIELEKQRDKIAEVNRIAAIESAVAVVRTILDAHLKAYADTGISEEDLKELKREWEAALRETITNIRDAFTTANDQQSTTLLGQVQSLLAADRLAAAEDQKNLRRQIFFALFTWGLGIIGALIVFWLTTRGGH